MEHLYLYILLLVALLIIAGLSCALYRCRRRLSRCQWAMVRMLNENIEMKDKLLGQQAPFHAYPIDLTPREFSRIIHNMLKRLMFLSVLCLLAGHPQAVQEPADCPHAVRANDAFEAKLTTINPTLYTSYEK